MRSGYCQAVTSVDEAKRAQAEGRAANINDRNPYPGPSVLGVAWRNGYRYMQKDRIATSKSYLDCLSHRPNN